MKYRLAISLRKKTLCAICTEIIAKGNYFCGMILKVQGWSLASNPGVVWRLRRAKNKNLFNFFDFAVNSDSALPPARGIAAESPQDLRGQIRGLGAESPVFLPAHAGKKTRPS
ncbi:MAG: hypothetical protein LBK13_03340 [Spirochaetales bacterium]|jgi:hypothetical protein|nr:hypothetical protein [Spirochaetales bacterium]